MAPLARFLHRLLNVFRPGHAETDLTREIDAHLTLLEDDFQRRGLSADDARRAAVRAFGGVDQAREQHRDARSFRWIEDTARDVRHALRSLRRTPGFTAVAVVTLALGIGASTAIMSAVNPILFEPLPYPDAGRIMAVWYGAADGGRALQAFGTFRELQARSRAFEALAVVKPWQRAITGTGEPERLDGQQVSAGYFGVLGVPPALGRDFSPSDDRPDGPKVVMLSDAVWHRRFAADVSIVGRQITLNEALYTVVGVMPRGFENVLAPSAEIWSLLQYDPSPAPQSREWGHHLRMIGRVRPGARIDQAQRELDTIARDAMAPFTREPGSNMTRGLIVNALQDDVTREVKPVLLAVLGAVALVLIIACVNVTTLLLARAAQRHAEFSMRVALGAGRGRLTRQLLTESVLLAFIAGALGLGLAGAGVRALVALAPPGLPRAAAIAVDRTVFAYAFGLSTIIGGLVGLMAALQATRGDLRAGLQRGAWRGTGGQHRTRATLVVIEIALSVVLLVGAGLLLRSLERVFAIAPGFDPSHVLTMQVQLSSPKRFPDNAAFHRFYARALEAVRGVPGVVAAGFTSELPLSGDDGALDEYGVQIDERLNAAERVGASRYLVTAGYFELMRIPVRRGRSFDERDMAPATVRLILVSEAFAKSAFGDRDPIGQRVRFGGPPSRPWDVIVGVAGDVKQASLASTNASAVYATTSQWLWAETPLWLVVRANGDAAALAPAVKSAVWSVDKDQPIVRVATMDHLLSASEAGRRFALIVFEAFGLVSLALAAIGIYGVLSGSVVERRREIGVRSALGASRAGILGLVVRQGLTLAALGVAIGAGAAIATSRAIITLPFDTSPLDPITYAGVLALLLGVSAIACAVPALRAARVDPMIALRCE